MAAPVYVRSLAADGLTPPPVRPGLVALCGALGLAPATRAPAWTWAVKVALGAPHRPVAVDPAWARTIAGRLPGRDVFCWDTLSITTAGLDTPGPHRERALQAGYEADGGSCRYVVADAPEAGPPLAVEMPDGADLPGHRLAGGLAAADAVCVLTPVRAHPHLGFRGAVASLGLGAADRDAEIALHRDLRPQVDTPLCAGCGVCMTVCVFDAIRLRAGRATIDHTRCTGCGECMNVCFMAGIAPEDAAGIPRFQARVAAAALAARNRLAAGQEDRTVYFNFLLDGGRYAGGPRRRDLVGSRWTGIAASRDPVALDQATWDLIAGPVPRQLAAWSGFGQVPEALLARAAAAGLGARRYELLTV